MSRSSSRRRGRKLLGQPSRRRLTVRVRDGVLTIEVGAGRLHELAETQAGGRINVDPVHFARHVAEQLDGERLGDVFASVVNEVAREFGISE